MSLSDYFPTCSSKSAGDRFSRIDTQPRSGQQSNCRPVVGTLRNHHSGKPRIMLFPPSDPTKQLLQSVPAPILKTSANIGSVNPSNRRAISGEMPKSSRTGACDMMWMTTGNHADFRDAVLVLDHRAVVPSDGNCPYSTDRRSTSSIPPTLVHDWDT